MTQLQDVSVSEIGTLRRHYVLKARYDVARDNFHVQPAKNKFRDFDRRWPGDFALVAWLVVSGEEQFFAVPYSAIKHLFQGVPNRGTCWDVHIVRGRLYAGSEALGVVDVSSCRGNHAHARHLVVACRNGVESRTTESLAALAAGCHPTSGSTNARSP